MKDVKTNLKKNSFLPISMRHKPILPTLYAGIIVQLVAWFVFYVAWHESFAWRDFSSPPDENVAFGIVVIGIYCFYFVSYRRFYLERKPVRFFGFAVLFCLLSVVSEYYCVIDAIISHIPGSVPIEEYLDVVSYTKKDTIVSIFFRDLALFSIVGFGLIFRDALKYVKVQKEELAYWRERHSFQNEIEGHRRHEHFAGNLFNAYLAAHPGEQQDLAECLYLYNFSARNNTQAFYPLRQEVDFAKRLIAFYEKLYPEAVVYCQEKGDMPAVYILPLVTESLIGNMFKHGVTGQGGCMSVCFDYTNPDEVKMQFRNKVGPGRGFARRSGARGLDVLSRRLDLAYGKDAVLQWDFPGDEVVATLTIPV